MANLILVRHGYSEYNVKGLWTGWDDPDLTQDGKKEAEKAAKTLRDIPLDCGYTSPLIRHKETLEIMKRVLKKTDLPTTVAEALKERNYGIYTAKNKWQIKQSLGEEEFKKLRRGWDYPIPEGESLKQVYERAVPYFLSEILPKLKTEKNIIVSSSGNVLRSLVKYLESIGDDEIADLEIAPGEVYLYTVDTNGAITDKEIRNAHPNTV
ncbi:MAG: 2,3-bisphosphoglycerate-dependent phosphoglycerate mutase [Candidatus Levybacteria bacterium]|nr:2,3-bisphosphoglycerate-dependent phosphoglycerate mutase [Candidatus Levybacteria bacterium]